MSKLPTIEDYGARPVPQPNTNVVAFQGGDIPATVVARGNRQAAANVAELGNLASDIVDGEGRQRLATARTNFLVDKAEIDRKYKHDPDWKTKVTRYEEEINKVRERHGADLFGTYKNKFESESKIDIASGKSVRDNEAYIGKRDHNLGEMAGNLDRIRKAALEADDPSTRESLLRQGQRSIQAMREQGFLSAPNAEKMQREFAHDYAVSRVKMQPPAELHRVLGVPAGWSPNDKLPNRKKDGTYVDLLSEDERVTLARSAMPGINARVAIEESDRITAEGGSIEQQLEKAKKNNNPIVRKDIESRLKANYVFTKQREADALERNAQDLWTKSRYLHDPVARAESIRQSGADPDIIKRTLAISDNEFAREQRVKTANDRELKTSAWQQVTKDNTLNNLTPEQRGALDGNTLAAMERYARTKQEGKEPVTNRDKWSQFLTMPKEEFAKMSLGDFYAGYRNELDDAHFDRGALMIQKRDSAETKINEAIERENRKRVAYGDADATTRRVAAAQRWKPGDARIKSLSDEMNVFVEQYYEDNDRKYPPRSELNKFAADQMLRGEIQGSGTFSDDKLFKFEIRGRPDSADWELRTSKEDLPKIAGVTGIPFTELDTVIEGVQATQQYVTTKRLVDFYYGFSKGKTINTKAVSERLKVTPEQLDDMIAGLQKYGRPINMEELERIRGYLK